MAAVRGRRVLGWLVMLIASGATAGWGAEAPLALASGGRALQPVIVAPGASERVRVAADELAAMLGRIAGAEFGVEEGGPERGIVVGLAADFAGLALPDWGEGPAAREAYWLRSEPARLLVIGATDLAVEDAVWDLLGRVGVRQYFPGPTWEVVPRTPELTVTVDTVARPDYVSRRIWYGFGLWDYNGEPWAEWCRRNRCREGLELRTGHAYDAFVKRHRDAFEAHPEYWPLQGGERREGVNKPCLGNPAVRALMVADAVQQCADNPALDSVSMDPSDGGGWCECELCAALGSVSDQVVTVANEVAEAINQDRPGRVVGIYAYNFHSPPPAVRVDPRVVVSVATAFIKGGFTLDELVAGWQDQGATLGIREYYAVNTWSRDEPAGSRGGDLAYLTRTIPEFHRRGARFLSAESSDNWGPNGLGYWLAARLLWDVDEAGRADALVDDFLTHAFGPAAEAMRGFYEQLDGSVPHLSADDQLGRMFRALAAARPLAPPEVGARLDELTLYAHYASLYRHYATASGPARQAAFEALIRHAYRMRRTMLVHTKALYRDLVNRDKTVAIPDGAGWQDPEPHNPWKSSAPFTPDELAGFLRDGVAAHPLTELAFAPVIYGDDLVPAGPVVPAGQADLPLPEGSVSFGPGRGTQTFVTWATVADTPLMLQLTGGLIAHYRDRGNLRVTVTQLGGASQTGEGETVVAQDRSVPPDGETHELTLRLPEPGRYRVTVSDGGDRTRVAWPAAQPMAIVSTPNAPMTDSYGEWTAWFYVPRGTRTIGLYGGGHGEVRDSQDRPLLWLNGRAPGYHAVDVPPGEDGTCWQIRYAKGIIHLLTVPPAVALTPGALLLPREVIEADRR